jgi:hypothetical protein
MNEKVKPLLIDYYKSSPNVKLPAHKTGLAGHLPAKNLAERDVGVGLVGQEGN